MTLRKGIFTVYTRPLLNEALSGVLEAPKESHEAFYVSGNGVQAIRRNSENA